MLILSSCVVRSGFVSVRHPMVRSMRFKWLPRFDPPDGALGCRFFPSAVVPHLMALCVVLPSRSRRLASLDGFRFVLPAHHTAMTGGCRMFHGPACHGCGAPVDETLPRKDTELERKPQLGMERDAHCFLLSPFRSDLCTAAMTGGRRVFDGPACHGCGAPVRRWMGLAPC